MAQKNIPVLLTVEIGDKKYGVSLEIKPWNPTFGVPATQVRAVANELAGMVANTVLTHFEAERGR